MLPSYYHLLDTVRGDFVLNAQTLQAISAVGNSWFVDEAAPNASDSNNGASLGAPFATLDAALSAAVANNNDTVYLMGTSHRTSTLTWNKNGVNLVALLSPSNNPRSRISSSGSSVFTPLVNVTATGCRFVGIGTFYGFDDASAQVCWTDTGGRNYYDGVLFGGGGNATAAAQAGMRSLTIGGSGENILKDCIFGLDTVQRITAANATLEISGGSPRNVIKGGRFQAYNGLATNVHILIASNGADRYLELDDVALLNFGTGMTSAITNAGGSPAANVALSPTCWSVGAPIGGAGNIYVAGPVPTATTSNVGILSH